MVGDQGNRTSGTREASVPQSYWWKRIHNLNGRSRFQEVSGSLNCAEKFSSLVSCHRGYGSVAFYAVFSLFILTFLYAIWKIVSAHSRSTRRPGSGNTTSVAKLNPTAHAPTGYVSTHAWLQKENVLHHFQPSVKNYSPFENESPQEKPSPVIFFPPENEKRSKISSVTNNNDLPIRGHDMLRNPSPTWTSRSRTTEPLYNYYPGTYNTIPTPLNNPAYPMVPYPSVVNPLFPTAPFRTGLNPYLRPPFLRGTYNNQRFQFRIPASNPVTYNSDSLGLLNERTGILSSPLANTSYKTPYYSVPTDKNTLSQGSYVNSYYGDNTVQIEDPVQTSPSPLISFFKGSSDNANTDSRLKKSKKERKRKKLGRKKTRHEEKKWKYDYMEDIERYNKENLRKAVSTRHRKVKHYGKKVKHLSEINYEKSNRAHTRHMRPYKRTRHLRNHKLLRAKTPKYLRSRIPHVTTRAKHFKPTRHGSPKVHSRRIHHHGRYVRVHHSFHRRHHSVLDFRLYRLYRRHHSINDEIRGKWSISRHQVRTCKLIDQFSTRGMVKLTRTKGKSRYLHTLLICRPVRLRIKRGVRRRRYSVKFVQLCSKKWYVTTAFIIVHKDTNDQEIPRYKVQICKPSYAHASKMLPAKNKETKVWDISKEVLRKMKTEDGEKINVKLSSVKHGYKRHNKKKKVNKHTKLKKGRERKREHKKWKHRNSLSRSHHARKGKKHHKHRPKTNNRFELRGKQSRKLKTLQDKRKKHHDRKPNKVLTKTENIVSKPKSADSDKDFYGKLLKVLKLAESYDLKKSNATRGKNVFDSLEAVLAQKQNITKYFPQRNKQAKVEPSAKKNKTSKRHIKKANITHQTLHIKSLPKNSLNSQENSQDNIQKLLAKLLPAVLKSVHGEVTIGDLAVTKATTKPTSKITTKPRTSTAKTTPASQKPPSTTPSKQIPPSTSKSSNDDIEEIMKNILPLLLKKTYNANSDSSKGLQPKPKEKQALTTSPKQSSLSSNKAKEKLGLKYLLSRLGMENLVSNDLSSTISAKATVTKTSATKPTQRLTVAFVKPKNPVHPPMTRPKPTSAVTTIQTPPPLSQPNIADQPENPPGSQSNLLPATALVSLPGLSSAALPTPPATPSSFPLPVPPLPSSPGPPASQPAFSPQLNRNNANPYSSLINSDPYSRNILCFGDSLTSGYYNHGKNFHPYSQRLSQLLNSDGRLRYYVKTSGKVREMAHGSMARRLPQVLGNSSRFDWVIILGGTNDVAHVKNFGDDDSFMNQLISIWKPRIVRDIEVLHEISHKYGARTVMLTIPETAYEAWPNFKTLWVMRRRLNQDLREYARRSQGNTVLCDLALKLPRHSISPQAQALLWNDHLHLTPFGYDKMAEIIYQCLKPYLSK